MSRTLKRITSRREKTFTIAILISIIVASLLILVNFYNHLTGSLSFKDLIHDKPELLIVPLITIITGSVTLPLLGVHSQSSPQLDKLRVERDEITKKIEVNNHLDIFHTIQLNLNQLNEYYTINKTQATTSFRFSLLAIVIGLIVIVSGISLNYAGNTNTSLSYITGVSGILLEFIGGAYFFMYKKSLEQVNFFFGQLIKVQDTMLAINLANDIDAESNKKVDIQEKIIVSLLERSLK